MRDEETAAQKDEVNFQSHTVNEERNCDLGLVTDYMLSTIVFYGFLKESSGCSKEWFSNQMAFEGSLIANGQEVWTYRLYHF